MGESELKTALQRDGEAQIRDFWQSAEATVTDRRSEFEAELTRLRAKTDQQIQAEVDVLRNTLLFEAQAVAMGCRLHEEAALAERLLLLARQSLALLANHDRDTLWQALCEELPTADWTVLTVDPADRQRGVHSFPAASITSEETLGGGLIAATADGMIRIDNSLNRRLMRAWPDLLPKLLAELRQRVDNDATAYTDTSL